MVFCWGILWLEAFVLVEGFGDRVIFSPFDRIYFHPVLGSYYSYCKNCIEISVLEEDSFLLPLT